MRTARPIAIVGAALMTANLLASCTGSDDCDASPLTPIAEAAAGIERATSCAPGVEFGGRIYVQIGCPPVRRTLIGSVVARNPGYVARSIDGVETTKALAIRSLHGEGRCGVGWHFWADADGLEPGAAENLARQVNRTGSLD